MKLLSILALLFVFSACDSSPKQVPNRETNVPDQSQQDESKRATGINTEDQRPGGSPTGEHPAGGSEHSTTNLPNGQ